MILRCIDADGNEFTESAFSVQEVLPVGTVFRSASLRKGITALTLYRDQVFPIKGPLPENLDLHDDRRTFWLLCYRDHARIVYYLPELLDQEEDEFSEQATAA